MRWNIDPTLSHIPLALSLPQVHGVVVDSLAFVEKILSTELNSSTDNPMVFYGDDERFNMDVHEGLI
jgi:histidine ammonia-lyase